MIALRLGIALLLGAVTATAGAADVAVYAAGSLRAPLTDVARAFERASGNKVVPTFDASGLLRDRIKSGERADVVASANMEHPQSLTSLGWQPGAFATLSKKAPQLKGGPQSPPPPADRSVYGMLIDQNQADLFLAYCTNAALAKKEQPALQVVKLPPALEVGAGYGLAVRCDTDAASRGFAAFALGAEGQRRLQSYGFDPA